MNHRTLIFSAAAVMFLLASCSQPDKVVEYPLIESANTMTLDFSKVELTDTATVLHTDAYYQPRYWIRISSDSYLLADGKKYALKATQGIEADSLFWMPDSGEASFTLTFEPLPKRTKSFDFIESDCEDCFKIFGIDLTGKKTYDAPKQIPSDLRQPNDQAAVPEPIFKSGETTVKLHLMGYRKELAKEVDLYVNTMFGRQQSYTSAIDAEGNATFTFLQCGPAQAHIVLSQMMGGDVWLAPGEETDVYMDMRLNGWRILYRRGINGKAPKPDAFRTIYATGTYADLTNTVVYGERSGYSMNIFNDSLTDYRLKADEYTARMTEQYRTLSDSVAQSDMSPILKELNQLTLKQQLVEALTQGDRIRELNYRQVNKMWDYKQKVKGIDPMKAENVAEVSKLFDVSDPKLLMGREVSGYVDGIGHPMAEALRKDFAQQGLVAEMPKVFMLVEKAEDAGLTEEDWKAIESTGNPFYREAFRLMEEKAKADLAAVEARAKIETAPDVSKEKLFDAIIAPYKGKVVLVDFWNTWCGPCRMALKANEPLKDAELKSDDLVWLYIANETSPIVKYKTMIPDIKGVHFRLNDEQWSYICDKFKIDGIPSYVLVDKSGAYKLRNDFRNHETMKKTLKQLIAE